MSTVTEALLEMMFFRPLADCFESVFGITFRRITKPSARQEAWVGFDQGWVNTAVSSATLLAELTTLIQQGATSAARSFVGYFLQFKPVEMMMNRSRYMPDTFDTPYYRAELSLSSNRTTGKSQHETLVRLSQVPGALVYYACPMILSEDDLLRPPDLELLRVVNVSSAPTGWLPAERHFIAFRKPTDNRPVWNSEPVPTEAESFPSLVHSHRLHPVGAREILKLISNCCREIAGDQQLDDDLLFRRYAHRLPSSFHLMSFERSGASPQGGGKAPEQQ